MWRAKLDKLFCVNIRYKKNSTSWIFEREISCIVIQRSVCELIGQDNEVPTFQPSNVHIICNVLKFHFPYRRALVNRSFLLRKTADTHEQELNWRRDILLQQLYKDPSCSPQYGELMVWKLPCDVIMPFVVCPFIMIPSTPVLRQDSFWQY